MRRSSVARGDPIFRHAVELASSFSLAWVVAPRLATTIGGPTGLVEALLIALALG